MARVEATGIVRFLLPTLLLALCLPSAAASLTIQGRFTGGTPAVFQSGGGTIEQVFEAAAGLWERAIRDDASVELRYGWAPIDRSSLGDTSGTEILLDNDTFSWFVDPTPDDDTEWVSFREMERNLGGGAPMVTGRVHSFASPASLGRFDLLTVMLHQIGHALGFDGATVRAGTETLDGDVDVTSPRPHAGATIPVTTLNGTHLNLPEASLHPFFRTGERRLLSAADILAVAQVNGWSDVELAPARVPEPRAGLLLLLAGAALRATASRRRG